MKKIFSTILFLVLTLMVSLVGCSNGHIKESTSTAEKNTTSYTSADEVISWIDSTLRDQVNNSIGHISLSDYSAISKELNNRISKLPENSKPRYYALERLKEREDEFFQIRIRFEISGSDIDNIATLSFHYPYACVYFYNTSIKDLKKNLKKYLKEDSDTTDLNYSIGEENDYTKLGFYF